MKRLIIILLVLTLFLPLVACNNQDDQSVKPDIGMPTAELLDELDSIEVISESDESKRFSYIVAYADHEVIFFDINYEFPSNLFIYKTEVDGKVKYGYMDEYFNKVTEPISNDPNIFNFGMARITEDDGTYLIYDNLVRIDEYYPGFMIYDDDLLIVDWTDRLVEKPTMINDVDFDSYLVPIKSKEATSDEGKPLYGYMTLNNAVSNKGVSEDDYIITPLFESAGLFYDGLAAVEINDKWGYINEVGKIVIDLEYDEVRNFYQGFAQVYDADYHFPGEGLKQGYTDDKDLGRWGMINMKGSSVTSFIYHNISPFINDLSFATIAVPSYYESSFYSILRPDGTPAYSPSKIFNNNRRIHFAFEPIPFSEGIMPVSDGSYVFINETGEKVFGNEFEKARGFSDGMAAVQLKTKIRWGYIDKTGNLVLPDIYTYACEFDEGYAYVRDRITAKGYLIDKMGNHYLEDLELHGVTKFNEDGTALGFKRETKEVEIYNEKTGMHEKVIKTFYTYYIINVIY